MRPPVSDRLLNGVLAALCAWSMKRSPLVLSSIIPRCFLVSGRASSILPATSRHSARIRSLSRLATSRVLRRDPAALRQSLLREEERDLEDQLRGRRVVWPDDVVVGHELGGHRQLAEFAQLVPAR